MRRCGTFTVRWRIAECGRPVLDCELPATVRHMPAACRAHMAQRVRDCLLYVIPVDPNPYAGPDNGLIWISWEKKERDRIAAGAEIPPGQPRPPLEVRKRISLDFAELLRKAEE